MIFFSVYNSILFQDDIFSCLLIYLLILAGIVLFLDYLKWLDKMAFKVDLKCESLIVLNKKNIQIIYALSRHMFLFNRRMF